MKILLVEQYGHPKVVENTCQLFAKNGCSVTVYANKGVQPYRDLPVYKSNPITSVHNPLPIFFFFWKALFLSRRYDTVLIATGPECNDYWEVFNVVFFYVYCLLYGNKIILTMKNVRSYLESSPGIFNYIRSRAVRKVRRFVFESETMAQIYTEHATEHAPSHSFNVSAIYDRYTDLIDPESLRNAETRDEGKIRIGLPGVIDPKRRNYDVVADALEMLSSEQRRMLQFVTLGGCPEGRDDAIIKRFAGLVEVDVVDGWITPEAFDSRGLSCHVLLAPLVVAKEYGTYKGSGAFGDAVYLRRKIILPAYVDPRKEFQKMSFYYSDTEELVQSFSTIIASGVDRIPESFCEKFTTQSVFQKLVAELKLQEFAQ